MMMQQAPKSLWSEDGGRMYRGVLGERVSFLSSSFQHFAGSSLIRFASRAFHVKGRASSQSSYNRKGVVVSVNGAELAHGLFRVSRDASPDAGEVGKFLSACGERMSTCIGPRPLLQFRKRLLIQPAVSWRRKSQVRDNSEVMHQGVALRPKSSFVKRSPIPSRKGIGSNAAVQHIEQTKRLSDGKGLNAAGQRSAGHERPPSNFVKRSPVSNSKPLHTIGKSEIIQSKAAVQLLEQSNGGQLLSKENGRTGGNSRPPSKFVKRLPMSTMFVSPTREVLPLNQADLTTHTSISKSHSLGSVPNEMLPVQESLLQQRSSLKEGGHPPLQPEDHVHELKLPLESLTKKALKQISQQHNPQGRSYLVKSELVNSLQNDQHVDVPENEHWLENLQMKQLREIARERCIRGFWKLRKHELVEVLKHQPLEG